MTRGLRDVLDKDRRFIVEIDDCFERYIHKDLGVLGEDDGDGYVYEVIDGEEVMGEKDLLEKHLVRKNEVFADIMNNITFRGRQILDSSTLQNLPTESDTKRMDDIILAVSKKYGISRDDILSDKRNAEIMLPRHICIYLARTCTNLSQAQIGKAINRDRTTVISSENKVKSLMEEDREFSLDINELVRQIKN